MFGRSRSKSATRGQIAGQVDPHQPLVYQNFPATGIPNFKEERKRAASISYGTHGYYIHLPIDSTMQAKPVEYSPPMFYYGPSGQVMNVPPYDPRYSPQSLDLNSRGRPRSNTAHEKYIVSPGGSDSVIAASGGYLPSEIGHEHAKGWFSSIKESFRSRSKSRERDSLSSHGVPVRPASLSYQHVDSRGRPLHQRQMEMDMEAELARRMEKDLRLQSFEDPYSSLRRDRSRSSDSERRRDRADARYRDVSPETKARTLYNAQHLKYPDERPQVSRIRSEHHNSGYYTDAQPSSMMRRSSTATAAPSSTRSSRSNQAAAAAPAKISSKGFYNRRGDQRLGDGSIIRQPRGFEYSSAFASYPEVGKGFANSYGTVIDVHGRILARCG